MPLWAFWEQPLRWPAPHFTCATNNPDYIFLWHSKPAPDDRWASSKALQLARVRCNGLPQQHAQLRRLLLSFPKRKLRRQVCTNCVIHETYVSQRLTNLYSCIYLIFNEKIWRHKNDRRQLKKLLKHSFYGQFSSIPPDQHISLFGGPTEDLVDWGHRTTLILSPVLGHLSKRINICYAFETVFSNDFKTDNI